MKALMPHGSLIETETFQIVEMLSFVIALATVTAQLSDSQYAQWDNLKILADKVADKDCSGEIQASFNMATKIYMEKGLSSEFMQQLAQIQSVSGDIDEAQEFRAALLNSTASYINTYNLQLAAGLVTNIPSKGSVGPSAGTAVTPTPAANKVYGVYASDALKSSAGLLVCAAGFFTLFL